MPDINIGQISEALNDKVDRDLNNRSNDSGLRKLIESYVNGATWYKIFEEIQEDGTTKKWCEQGGQTIIYSGYGATTLLKQYIDTNYTILISQNHGETIVPDFKSADIVAVDSVTVATFRILGSTNADSAINGVGTSWYTCGYIN